MRKCCALQHWPQLCPSGRAKEVCQTESDGELRIGRVFSLEIGSRQVRAS